MKYLLIAIEYFTKWIEVELVAQIMAHRVQHFLWKNIVCRFGILRRLISDNGTQLPSQQLGKLCTKLEIKQIFGSVEHPQTNGQAELAIGPVEAIKEKIRESEGELARRSSKNLMVLSLHPAIDEEGDTI